MNTEPRTKRRKSVLIGIFLYLNIIAVLSLFLAYLSFHSPPSTIGVFSIFGLMYPYILLANLVFILFWIFKRRRFTVLSLFAILIGFNHVRSCITFSSPDQIEEGQKAVSIMSYNAHLFGVYWSRSNGMRDSIFDMLEREKPDIICFQEFYQSEQNQKFRNAEVVMDLLKMGYKHERYTHATSGKEYFGVAMFSKYPIVHKGYLPFEGDPNNFCIYADIKIDKDTIRVYNGHLASIRFQAEDYKLFEVEGNNENVEEDVNRVMGLLERGFRNREVQAEKVALSVKESPHKVVLCGDFNDTPVSYCYNVLTNDLDDAFIRKGNGFGNTYIGKIPALLRIDHVLVSPEINVLKFERMAEELSDHRALKVEIAL